MTQALGRAPLDEGSARRRGLYLTTHNTQKRQTSMSQAGFESAIPASERPQTYALDRAPNGIGQSTSVPEYNTGCFRKYVVYHSYDRNVSFNRCELDFRT